MLHRIKLAALLVIAASAANAQAKVSLDTVRVTVTRDSARSPLTLPFAITASYPDRLRPGLKHGSLDETLLIIPGVFAASRQNPSQDPRISIRGFGSRSAFGIRGIRVIWDGIPLTVADGQTPVDYVDLDAVGRVEIIRGSASALFGNSSGGVIALSSGDTTSEISARQLNESGSQRKSSVRIARTDQRVNAHASLNHTSGHGFRDYSRVVATRASGAISGNFLDQNWSLHLSSLDMPVAQNPGSLTALQMKTNARLADPLSVRKRAGKSVDQKQIGLSTSRKVGIADFSATVFAGARKLDNPLTFATVNLNRSSGGMTTKVSFPMTAFRKTVSIGIGVDGQIQNDDRHELENCTDVPMPSASARCPVSGRSTGVVRRNQRELVSSGGAYLKSEVILGERTLLTLAARHDLIRFTVQDRMPVAAAQKQSGSRSMVATSPMLGLVIQLSSSTSLYVSASTAFETPTATELANRPDGSTGLNPDLRPQRSRTAEAGFKGFLGSGIHYDFAGFLTGVRDELIPFEIANGAGRRFYRNAGQTARKGFEAFTSAVTGPVELNLAYTASHFRFTRYTVAGLSYAGKTIPGIPASKLDAGLTLRRGRTFATAETTLASAVVVDDNNTARAPAYQILNLRIGSTIPAGTLTVRPVIGVTNVLNKRYSASININAAAGKYYEPGSERLLYGMVEIASRL